MRFTLAALVLAMSLPLLGGCGQTGPLFHPEQSEQQGEPAGTEK